jgi:ribonuclease D
MQVASVTPSNPTPSSVELPPGVSYVRTDGQLHQLFRELEGETLLALDTEAASFHRYEDRVFLIQLSSRTQTAVIDPLSVTDLAPIGQALADPGIEVVFHDADYDLRILDRDLGFRACSVFDTRIAAQLLREPGVGLAALLLKYLDISVDKKFQRADWSARPLSEPMLAYAATDTHHLTELRDILSDRLQASGRLAWAKEEFQLLEGVRWTPRQDSELDFLRIKGARALPPRSLAILRELHRWREATASKRDKAAFRILNNQPLLQLAKTPPKNMAALTKVSGVGPETARRAGTDILAAIERGLTVSEDDLPKTKRTPKPKADPSFDQRMARLKVARNAVAERLDLDPGVACPNGTLEVIASKIPRTLEELAGLEAVRQWQVNEFGEDLLKAITETGS